MTCPIVDMIRTTGTFPADMEFWLTETQVVFSAPSVTVPAHGSATVTATLTGAFGMATIDW